MTDNDVMPFGKYMGEKMINVPAEYLKFIYDEGYVSVKKHHRVYTYVKDNLEVIRKEIKENQSLV